MNDAAQTPDPEVPVDGPIMPTWKQETDIERIAATMVSVKLQQRLQNWPYAKPERKQAAYARGTCSVVLEVLFEAGIRASSLVQVLGGIEVMAIATTDERRNLDLEAFREYLGRLAEHLSDLSTDMSSSPPIESPGPAPAWTPKNEAERTVGMQVNTLLLGAVGDWPETATPAEQCRFSRTVAEELRRTLASVEGPAASSLAEVAAYLWLCVETFGHPERLRPKELLGAFIVVGRQIHEALRPGAR